MSELRSASDAAQSIGRQRLTGLEWQRKISALKIGVVFVGAILVSLQLWMIFHHQERPSGAAGNNNGNVTSAYERELWRKELTDGAKAFYGPDWKPSANDQRTIDAMAGEAADTYGTPQHGDE